MTAKFSLIFLWFLLLPFFVGQQLVAYAASGEQALFIDNPALAAKIRLDLIAGAKNEILVSTHIFKEDMVGLKLLSALQEAAQRGVKVRLIVDAYGDGISKAMKAALSTKEFEIYRFRPLDFKWLWNFNKRMHDKLFIVDGDKMVLGDRNIKDAYYRVSNKSFVSHEVYIEGQSAKDATDYFHTFLKDESLDQFFPVKKVTPEMAEKAKLLRQQVNRSKMVNYTGNNDWRNHLRTVESAQFIHDDIRLKGKVPGIEEDIVQFIGRQKKTLLIHNPYIDLTPKLKEAIKAAAARGVKITIVTNAPLSNDVKMIGALWEKNRPFFGEIGATVWELIGPDSLEKRPFRRLKLRSLKDLDRSESAVHSKVFVGDDETIVSSVNLDYRSEKLNLETGELIKSESFANEVKSVINHELSVLPYLKTVSSIGIIDALPGSGCVVRMMSKLFRKSL